MTREEALEQQACEDWYDVPSDEMTLEQARQAVKIMCENPIEDIIEHINYERGRGIPYKGGDTDGKSD